MQQLSHPLRMMLALALLAFQVAAQAPPQTFQAKLAALEARHGGRLGVAVVESSSHRRLSYRGAERFALCSTFKVALVAAVLARVDAGTETLDRRIPFGPKDLLEYAPVTRARVAEGSLTVAELCTAALEQSDNTAANLLLQSLKGPGAVTAFLRSLGDPVTRLDRNEPALNSNRPGDERDTTSPDAMLESLRKLLLEPVLFPTSRQFLQIHLKASETGKGRLRAGLPATWVAGDKSGTGDHGATNDIAVLWPPGRAPIFVTAYYSESKATDPEREAVLAEVGALVAAEFAVASW